MQNFQAGTYINQGLYKSFQPQFINKNWKVEDMQIMNLISALAAYSFFDKKPAIKVEWEEPNGQRSLFI